MTSSAASSSSAFVARIAARFRSFSRYDGRKLRRQAAFSGSCERFWCFASPDMILSGCSLISGSVCLNHKANTSKSNYFASSRNPYLPVRIQSSGIRSSWELFQERKPLSSKGSFAAASIQLLSGDHQGSLLHAIPILPRRRQGSLLHSVPTLPRRRPFVAPRASKDVPYSFRYPAMTKKPRWWWRTLACLPYLMPLHETWMYAETAYHLHPFLEDFEFLTYPFLEALGRLPTWFLMAYFFVAYLGIVRKKEWPHFFRFHVVMGMLLEIALQVVGTVSRWMPYAVYWGKIGMHFWTAVAFAFLFTVLECIRCALAGMYADIPFVCDAAYIQIPYD